MLKPISRPIGVLRTTLFLLLDGFLPSLFPKPAYGSRVLLARLDAIGDFVLWVDAARTLVGRFQTKGYEVVLLGNKAWVSWARDEPGDVAINVALPPLGLVVVQGM